MLVGDELKISFPKGQKPNKVFISEIKNKKNVLIRYLSNIDNGLQKNEIEVLAEQENYSLSSSQRRLWILSQFEGGSSAYNMPSRILLDGSYDIDLFKRAIYSVVDRHEILRTVFKEDSSGEIRQWILEREALGFEIGELDLRGELDIESSVLRYLDSDRMEEFDLAEGPLLRAVLLQVSEDSYVFYYNMHHIISDGWSMDVLSRDVFKYYEFYKTGNELELPELDIQYKDYASWQLSQLSTATYQGHRDYWTGLLGGDLPVLDLPSSKVRPVIHSHQGQLLHTYISKESTQGLKRFSHQEGGTLFMGLLSSLKALLYRYTGQEDLIIGIPVAGREHSDLEDQIGFYINMLALRNVVHSEDSFIDLFGRIRQTTLDAYEHQGYPFDRLVEDLELRKEAGRNVIYDISVVLQNFEERSTVLEPTEEMVNTIYDDGVSVSKNDIEFTFGEQGDYLYLNVGYNTDVYDKAMLEGFIVHYKEFLASLLSFPEASIGGIDYLNDKERDELLYVFNATEVAYPRDQTVVDLFESQVLKTPEAIAVVYEDERLSYEELNRRSNQLAHYLQAHYDIQPDDLIGIMLPRSSWMIVGILGILKSGGAYVPIDPDYPEDRKSYIISETNLKTLIINSESMFDVLDLETSILAIDIELEDYTEDIENTINSPHDIGSNDLAYVIYTSGSTGNPKGVMIEHKSIVRLVKDTNYFQINESDSILSLSNYAFDGSIFDIFMPLLNGGILVLSSKSVFLDIEKLNNLIKKENIDSFFLTTVLFNSLVESELDSLKGLKYVLFGGERVSVKHVRKFRELYPEVNLHHVYGPTENTTFSSWYKVGEIPKVAQTIPIGSGISNSTCYILDEQHHLVPKGVIGEIYLGGEGLARGYLKASELTSMKFIKSPFKEGLRLYKTGDLGRWTFSGDIEFIERKDNQVKIRGYRIELGEIESVLLGHSEIDQAVVLAYDLESGKELVAYFVSSSDQDSSSLRDYLKAFLPDYMLPSYYVALEVFPLTPNGKIDRRSLPSPKGLEVGHGVIYVAPETETQKKLVAIWEAVLGKDKIGLKDDFFELGGHSLKAMSLLSKLHKAFEVKLALKDLFVNTVLETQVSLLEEATKSEYVSIEKIDVSLNYAISDSQRRLWVLSQFDGGSSAYNIPSRILLDGSYDIELFKRAIYSVVDRHEILRTVFKEDSSGEIRQWILEREALGFEIGELDLRGELDIESSVLRYLDSDRMVEFDLAEGPLLRAVLLQVSEDRYVFYYNMHHIISDGWSMDVLSRDVFKYYEFYRTGNELELPELGIQYKDYASWQLSQLSTAIYQGHRDYWTDLLGGDLPVLDLPSSKVRPVIQSHQGQLLRTYISKESTQGLKRFSHQEGGTLFMGLLSSLKALLYRYTGQEDLVVGTPVAGREHSDLEDQIGFYINTLALRNEVRSEDSFEDLFRRVRQRTLDAYEHQGYPFDRLVEDLELRRDTSRSAVFDMMLVLQNTGDAHQGIGISDSDVELITDQGFNLSKFDLSFTFEERGDYLALLLEYNTDVYEQEMLEGFIVHYKEFLEKLLSNPEALIGSIDYLAEEERVELLDVFNATAFDYPRDKTVVELFEEQVSKTPEAIAVVYEEERLSYEELNRRSNQLAHYLQAHYTIEPDDLVGIMLPRSSWMIVGILGILKSGGAYVPIDPDYPEDRIAYMLEDSKCKVLLDEEFLDKFNNNNKSDYSTDNLSISLLPSNLLYVIYTSGSTGKPKGVMIEHSGVINRIDWMWKTFNFKEGEVVLQKTTFTFDVSVWEIFLPLCWGNRMIICTKEETYSPIALMSLIEKHGVNSLHFVPSMFNSFLLEVLAIEGAKKSLQSVKRLIASGESLSIESVRSWYGHLKAPIYNLYGPTEASIDVTYHKTSITDEKISIGVPISNTEIYILNREGLLQPIGVTGEIYIAGSGLARGYLNNESLTKERFVSNPFKEGTRMYKT
ncbi:non-ribosomal peptide synthetase, partial [Gillisia sp. Hel_I_29]|uniref:non-ribosomal peptide synthetase n=1 Tax=Gillisia sp. Hel_I_29 TaxID=1249975 RepID=UPI0018CEDCB4